MSDTSSNIGMSEPPQTNGVPKRKPDEAGFSTNGPRPSKSVKRRASKACQCCRARKVRCNVVEQIPCTNCRLDEVECIVSESKRKKKWTRLGDDVSSLSHADAGSPVERHREPSIVSIQTNTASKPAEHTPHTLCKSSWLVRWTAADTLQIRISVMRA